MIYLIIGIILVIVLFHLYFIDRYKYWEKRGIPSFMKHHPYIELLQVIFQKTVFFNYTIDVYNGLPDKQTYGVCPIGMPKLLIKDPNLVRNFLVKDFDHFVNHEDAFFKEDPIFGKSLIALKDKKWRDMRTILTPVFTGSKLRGLCQLISECGEQSMAHYAKQYKEQNETLKIDFLDACKRFTNDVIASVAFGIKVNSLADRNNEFFLAGNEVTKFPIWRMLVVFLFPSIINKILDIRFAPKSIYDFFRKIVEETIRARKDHNIIRYDMIHLLMEARKEQMKTIADAIGDNESVANLSNNLLTNDDITAQGFVFFLAGYGNVAMTMAFAAYELALQPELQKRLQNEISVILKENNGKLDYDVIKKMKYLDMILSDPLTIFIQFMQNIEKNFLVYPIVSLNLQLLLGFITDETLRKWPPLGFLDRECNKSYEIVTNDNQVIHIEPGTKITIPAVGFHYDPKYYPNPQKFDPERFNDENKAQIDPYTYMPFGAGPRICIAARFVLLETKIFLVQLLSQFDVVVTEKTPIPMVLAAGSVLKPKEELNLGLKLRN